MRDLHSVLGEAGGRSGKSGDPERGDHHDRIYDDRQGGGQGRRHGGFRIGEYPGAVGVHAEELVVKNVENVLFERIVEHLTQPRDGGRGVAPAVRVKPAKSSMKAASKTINEYFRNQGWTDELPIIPPTVARVDAFLKHTDRAPDEPIAVLPQANLVATPCNIAANGVMAGCSPECMPVLIAPVEAIADNTYNLANIGTTWGVLPYCSSTGPRSRRWASRAARTDFERRQSVDRARARLDRQKHRGLQARPQLHGHVRLSAEFHARRKRRRESVGAVPRRARFQERRQHRDRVRERDVGLGAGDLRHARQDRGRDRTRIHGARAHQEAVPRAVGGSAVPKDSATW